MIEDKLLIWRFKGGRPDALRRIYEKYKNDLLKLAVALANDTHTAEDAVQAVFVKLAQSAAYIRLNGSLKSYLTTCVANDMRNRIRDRQRHEILGLDYSETLICPAPRPDQWIVLSEELRQLSQALVQIPYEQREVVILHLQGEMSFRRIAQLQDTSINTVQGRYRYGMTKLRTLLNSEVQK